jgi:PAS domain S-box-containing protein
MEKKTHELLSILTLEQVLKTMPSGLFLVDLEQSIVYWNDEAERLTGYTAEEALGRHCSFLEGIECGTGCSLYNPQIRKPIIGASCTIRTKTGAAIHLSKNVDQLLHNGQVVGGIESFVDQTRQIKLERQLRQHTDELEGIVQQRTAELETKRNQLSTLLATMADPVYITRPDFAVVYANRALEEIFGKVAGACCYKVFYQREQPCDSCPMDKILEQQTIREECLNPVNNRTYEVIHTPTQLRADETLKLAVCRDITERKAAETALWTANQELDAFVHTVSHDLRTPLTPIIGYAEFLQSEYEHKLDPSILGILHEIETQGHKMLKIMEDLLELARIGKLEAPEEEISLQQVVRGVIEEHQQAIADLEVELRIEPLPGARLPATLLHQLFTNLVGNALNYGCPQRGRLDIGGWRAGRTLHLYVRDYGAGIPEAEREKIFKLFSRGSNSQRRKGTGIGLTTVAKIARIYNGRTRAEETPGGGCTIRIELLEPQNSPA